MKITGKDLGWPGIVLGTLLLCLLPVPGSAQNARLSLNNLEKLNNKAAEVNDVTLEGEMLKLASKFMEMDGDSEARQIREMIKDLKGVYVKNFEFDQPDQYSQADVAEIRAQLAAPGWSKIVESRSRGGEHNEIYVMKQGDKIAGVVILVAEPKELSVVNLVGPIDLDKLSMLEGKFGIPQSKEQPQSKEHPKAKSSTEVQHAKN